MESRSARLAIAALICLVPGLLVAESMSFPDVIQLPDGFGPEGIAIGRGTDFFVGSLATGAVYKGSVRTGLGQVLVPARPGERFAVGLSHDRRSDYLFVAGAFSGQGYVYDATGADAGVFQLTAPGSLVNDVVVTWHAAYFTDSFRPALYRLPLGPGGRLPAAGSAQELLLSGEFVHVPGEINANGIDATPNGDWLVVGNLFLGTLYRVDPWSGYASQIDLGGQVLPAVDGILLRPGEGGAFTIYAVQNFLNQIAVVQLEPDLLSGAIVDLLVSAEFRVPTTVAGFGSRLYAVNARFDVAPPPLPPPPDLEFQVVAVDRN